MDTCIADKLDLGLHDKWRRFHELGKNRHWRGKNKNLSLISANLLHVHRRKIVNLLTDNNPTFNVRALTKDEQAKEKTNRILRTAEHWWNETEQQSELTKAIFKGETYGVCIEKSRFDITAEYGIGEAVVDQVDPFNFAIYPPKQTDVQKAEAVLHFYPMSVRKLRRMFPDKAEQIAPDYDAYNDDFGDSRRQVSGLDIKNTIQGGGATMIGGALKNLAASSIIGDQDSDEALVVECWVKDYTMETYEVEVDHDDEMGRSGAKKKEYRTKPKYDGFIRCITVCNFGLVLADRSNPSINPQLPRHIAVGSYLYDKFPFNSATSDDSDDTFWGESDFEQLANLQMEIDKSISQYATLKDKVAGVKIINPKTSGVDNARFANGVNVINPEAPLNHGITYMKPPPIPPDLLNSLDIFRDLFFMVAGSFNLEQAQGEGSQVIAYKAIAALIEQASTMIRGKIRSYGKLIRTRGRMYVSQAQNWYTEDRIISYDENGREEVVSITGRDFDFSHKLMVVSGSTMPRSQVQMREEAIELYKMDGIDREELLKKLDWPNFREIIQRMDAGPIEQFLQSMAMVGMPEEMIQFMQDIAQTDVKKLERKVDRHEIPMFTEIFNIEGINEDPQKAAQLDKTRTEVGEAEARIRKMDAEIVEMQEKVKIERTKAVAEAKAKAKEIQ